MTGVLHPRDLIDRRRMPSIEDGDGGAARVLKALVQGGLGLDPACLRAAALLVVALETQATGTAPVLGRLRFRRRQTVRVLGRIRLERRHEQPAVLAAPAVLGVDESA
jgi:hypothetical protein